MKLAVIVMLFLISCSSVTKIEIKDLDIKSIDAINIGDSEEQVAQIMGLVKKDYILKEKTQPIQFFWSYSTKDNLYNRATISFDFKTHLVVEKFFTPLDKDPELSLNFVLQNKFKGIEFQVVPLKRCLDFLPVDTFYFNAEHGLSIKYDRHNKTVENITWSNSQDVKDHIHRIETCQKNDYEIVEMSAESPK